MECSILILSGKNLILSGKNLILSGKNSTLSSTTHKFNLFPTNSDPRSSSVFSGVLVVGGWGPKLREFCKVLLFVPRERFRRQVSGKRPCLRGKGGGYGLRATLRAQTQKKGSRDGSWTSPNHPSTVVHPSPTLPPTEWNDRGGAAATSARCSS